MSADLAARAMLLAVALSLAQCSLASRTPMTQPVQVMVEAWGPFSRQCTTTRTSHYQSHRQLSPTEVVQTHTTCVGFSALPRADGSVEVTASMNADNPGADPIVSRILRSPSGASRTAIPGEPGLLAYGSDVPADAAVLARDIGVTPRQLIAPDQSLQLPIRLHLPSAVDGELACHSSGETIDRGRKVLVLDCTLDQDARTERLEARIHLAGEQQVDIATGIRLSGEMSGWMNGRARLNAQSPWQPADERVLYTKETEFD